MIVNANHENTSILDALKPEKLSQSHFYFQFQVFSKKNTLNPLEVIYQNAADVRFWVFFFLFSHLQMH